MTLSCQGVVLITDHASKPGQSETMGRWLADRSVDYEVADMSEAAAHGYIHEYIGDESDQETPFVGLEATTFFTFRELVELPLADVQTIFGPYMKKS